MSRTVKLLQSRTDASDSEGSAAVTVSASTSLQRSKSDGSFKKNLKSVKSAMFYQEITDALHSKVADFMTGVSELDDEETMTLKQEFTMGLQEVKAMVNKESSLRSLAEERLLERIDKLAIELAALNSLHTERREHQQTIVTLRDRIGVFEKVNDRISTLETMFGASSDKTTKEILSLKRELDATKQAHHSCANVVDALDYSLKDITASSKNHAKAHQGHTAALTSLENAVKHLGISVEQTTNEMAATRAKILEFDKRCCTLDQRSVSIKAEHAAFVENLEKSLNEALAATYAQITGRTGELEAKVIGIDQQYSVQFEGLDRAIQGVSRRHSHNDERVDGQSEELRKLAEGYEKSAEELRLLKASAECALHVAQSAASELQATREELDQLFGVLCCVQKAWSRSPRRSRRFHVDEDGVMSPKTPKTPKTPIYLSQ